MHELSIAMALVTQLENLANQHSQGRVVTAHVQIGPLAGVEGHLLSQAFPLAAAGGPAAGCQLILTTLPVRIYCPACDKEAEVPANRHLCPTCGHWQTKLLSGDELLLARVILEEEE